MKMTVVSYTKLTNDNVVIKSGTNDEGAFDIHIVRNTTLNALERPASGRFTTHSCSYHPRVSCQVLMLHGRLGWSLCSTHLLLSLRDLSVFNVERLMRLL